MSPYDFHPEAELDLDEIWEYVAENSERAADRLLDDIEAALLALARFPHQGQVRPELTGRPLRFKPVRSYLIAYAPNERPLWVVESAGDGGDPAWPGVTFRNGTDAGVLEVLDLVWYARVEDTGGTHGAARHPSDCRHLRDCVVADE